MRTRKTTITVASAAALAAALPMVKHYEGLWLTVKPDTLARGLPTGGYGETEGVQLGETHDEKFWSARLAKRLPEYDRKLGECIRVVLPDGVRAVAISLAYNAGAGAVCRSPMVAKWNANDVLGGCRAIRGWYIRSAGQVRQGLINRRNDEATRCENGAKPVVIAAPAPKHHWWSWIFK